MASKAKRLFTIGYEQTPAKAVLDELEQAGSPFVDASLGERGVHWAQPELVGEVEFSEWTDGGRLRHPRFVGLRRDKSAREVVRERPA